MAKFLLKLLLILFAFNSFGQTFRGIIFTNTNDKTIGHSATMNTGNVKELMTTIADKLNLTAKINVYNGDSYKFETLDSVLKSLKTDSGDVVFFYLNSHGYKSSNSSKFPRIYIKSATSNRYLVSTDTINARLKSHSTKPSSIITIIQACNRLTSGNPDLPIIANPFNDYSEENLKTLFYSNSNVMVTSSQRGKTSIATPKGSHFTLSFIKALTEECQNTNPGALSWNGVLEKSKEYSLYLNRRRYPVWKITSL